MKCKKRYDQHIKQLLNWQKTNLQKCDHERLWGVRLSELYNLLHRNYKDKQQPDFLDRDERISILESINQGLDDIAKSRIPIIFFPHSSMSIFITIRQERTRNQRIQSFWSPIEIVLSPMWSILQAICYLADMLFMHHCCLMGVHLFCVTWFK